MKRIHMVLLALLSALLFSIPYFRWGTGLLLMVAFVPLLFIEDSIASSKSKVKSQKSQKGGSGKRTRTGSVMWYAILTFALFVGLTTYWVYFATWVGIVASLIVNTTYMTLTFWLFHFTRRRLGDRLGYASLVVFWLTFEFLYLRAQINFPWLVLGNGFANDIILIQWYEITGTLGGSLWALLMNLVIFKLLKGWLENRDLISGKRFLANRARISWVVGIFMVPFLFSLVRFLTYEEKEDPYEVVVLQPNIDPYLKFIEMPQEEQTAHLLRMADSLVTPQTEYIVGPETFINNGVWVAEIQEHPEILKLKAFLSRYPRAKLVLGATTRKLYMEPSEYTSSSRPIRSGQYRYDSFNSAFQLDSTGKIPFYHKSLLVTGVEKMPHTKLLGFLERLTVKLGGTFRSHGTQEFREAFVSPQDSTKVGPVICWESVFGEYVTDYVGEAGAHFIFIVTNDGWWRNTPGHRQHNSYARLRAIETRRSIARSANTGISSLINQRGQELDRAGWWIRSGLRGTLNKNDNLTFYVRFGDFLGRISVLVTVILLLYALVIRFVRK
jgi:apolipoprotein N-acyltransferase